MKASRILVSLPGNRFPPPAGNVGITFEIGFGGKDRLFVFF